MPIIKSAIKRAKQAEVRRERNDVLKRNMKSSAKAVETAVKAGDKKKMDEALRTAYSTLDTAVKKNYIHKNKAANKKSALNALVKNAAPVKKSAPAKKKAAEPKAKPAAKKTATKAKAPAKKATKSSSK